ncbi:MAG: hypothetical protein KC731_07725 [Myxococcales bacterium]|nr:hypothetical protein [Myxococcales bacterium]
MRLRHLGGALGLATLVVIAILPAVPPAWGGPDCDHCKPTVAIWDWKGNGYALGGDAEAAGKAALEDGRAYACDKAAPYLEKNPVKCKGGCTDGEVSQTCAVHGEPKCTQGTAESDDGMWLFICRKARQKNPDAPACDAETKKSHPGWGMCDVPVRAEKTRTCDCPG